MSQIIVESLKANLDRSVQLLEQFISVCPEDIWSNNFGGWPVWQQVCHTVACVPFFIAPVDAVNPEGPFEADIILLKKVGMGLCEKALVLNMLNDMKKMTDAYINGLTDETLGEVNAGLTQRAARGDITHAATLSMMATHNFYHLGSCDAALRQRGLAGVH